MKTVTVLAVLASASLLAACDRADNTATTAPGVGNPATTADVRASSVPPITPSTTATTPPALPAPADLPHGAGDAAPDAAAANAGAPGTHSGTARDTPATSPDAKLTPQEESTAMPKAGQVNNYNTPAREESRGKGSDTSQAPTHTP
jgi:hypothetical protein